MFKTGEIQLITTSYRTRVQLEFDIIKHLHYHDSMITDISEVVDPLYIVTSSMDGQIKLYSKLL